MLAPKECLQRATEAAAEAYESKPTWDSDHLVAKDKQLNRNNTKACHYEYYSDNKQDETGATLR